jgi:hypothetical protein
VVKVKALSSSPSTEKKEKKSFFFKKLKIELPYDPVIPPWAST